VKKVTLIFLCLVGLSSTFLSSCANHEAYTGPNMNPAYYNPDSREFESRWPFGPGGFR
jgi:hypothetical protein